VHLALLNEVVPSNNGNGRLIRWWYSYLFWVYL